MLFPSPAAPAAVIGDAGEALASLHERLWAAVTDEQLIDGITALTDLQAQAAAVQAQLLAEIDHREIPRKQLAWASTAEWFAHLAGLNLRDARRAVRHAPLLVAEREATLDALADGTISPEQADVICHAIDQFPLSPTLREDGERALLAEAGQLNATELRKTATYLVERVDPDRAERKAEAELDREDRAAHLGRTFTVVDDGAGGVRIKGRGSLEDGAVLRAALLPLTAPVPAIDPDNPDATDDLTGPGRDPRDHGARMWDALVGIAQHSLDTNLAPTSHGARPRVSVLIDLDDLRTRIRTGQDDTVNNTNTGARRTPPGPVTDDGLTLSVAAVRRLACDADLIPVGLGSHGQVLDVGRTHRLVTAAIWLALVARDHHCTFPGCTRPPVMCHAHHIRHWADGGPTSLANLVLLCGAHHRVIHDTPWEVRLNPDDGRPEFRPPPRRTRDSPTRQPWIRHRPRRE